MRIQVHQNKEACERPALDGPQERGTRVIL